MTTPANGKLDPVTLEILEHKLWQITSEMGMTLARVTGSPVTIDAKDYATALLRADGALLMISCGVLFHAVTLPYAIEYILEKYQESPGIYEGDVFLINDPYICSVHAPDLYVVAPVHYKGELVGWAGSMTHLVDIGGIDPGGMSPRAEDCWQEGLRLPGVKLIERGERRQDIWNMLLNMVRDPGMVGLDIRGQVACSRVAAQRLPELIEAYGLDTYNALTVEVIESAETRMRARLLELPDGVWSTRVYYDEDGRGGEPYEVHIKMTKEADTLAFDLAGTSEQAPSFINSGVTGAAAGVFGSVAPLVAYDIPWCQGVINAITVHAPEGTLLRPRPPAPTSLGTVAAADSVMCGVQDLVSKMFIASGSFQEDLSAMWGSACGSFVIAAVNQYGDFRVQPLMQACGTGSGARSYMDGGDTSGVMYIPEIMVPNVETNEFDLPLLFLYSREAQDSGGPGKWRGGTALEYGAVLHDCPTGSMVAPHLGRGAKAPLVTGLFGGYPAANFALKVKRGANVDEEMESGRVPQSVDDLDGEMDNLAAIGVTTVGASDIMVFRTHGGGGYGDPLDRNPELVRADVAAGNVSTLAARDVYGVVVDEQSLELDVEGTDLARRKIRETRLQAPKGGSS